MFLYLSVKAIEAISELRRIPQMIELLNAGNGEPPVDDDVDGAPSWSGLFDGVAKPLVVTEDEVVDGHSDATEMQLD